MTRQKAIQRILTDLKLTAEYESYIQRTISRLGCDDTLDFDTVKAVEQVIRNDLR